jgi:DNA-binding transcriptional regulator YhcF (GntR family)
MDEGYIKIFRSIESWEWYTDEYVFRVWIHLLLHANWKEGRFKGKVVPRGSLITSAQHIADTLKISRITVVRALNKLKSTGEITVKTNHQHSHIFINKYEHFQDMLYTTDTTVDTTPDTTPDTQYKNSKNSKKERKKEYIERSVGTRFVPPSLEEVRNYINENFLAVDPESFVDYYEQSGWRLSGGRGAVMKDWKAACRNWHNRHTKDQKKNNREGWAF